MEECNGDIVDVGDSTSPLRNGAVALTGRALVLQTRGSGFEFRQLHMKKMINFHQVIPKGYKNVYAVWKFNRRTAEIGKLLETNDNLKSLFKKYGNEGIIYGITQIKGA